MAKKKRRHSKTLKKQENAILAKSVQNKGYSRKWLWVVLVLLILISISAYIRISVPYDDVIPHDRVRFPSPDAYQHMRIADYVYDNWPDTIEWDNQLSYPDGQKPALRSMNGWLIATIAKFSRIPLDIVGAFWPAILGILLIIPVFIISTVIFNRWAGLAGAGLVSTIPGEIMGRTSLGFSDHHALEVFLAITFIMFFILAVKRNKWYMFGSGAFLGLYMINWEGAPILVATIVMFTLAQTLVNHFRNIKDFKVAEICGHIILIGTAIYSGVYSNDLMYIVLFLIGVVACYVVGVLAYLLRSKKTYYYPLAIVLITFAGFGIAIAVIPDIINKAIYYTGFLTGTYFTHDAGYGQTISEIQPLFHPYGKWTFEVVWAYFGFAFFFAVAGVILLIKRYRNEPEILLLIIWTIAMFTITVLQRRFGYYLAINVSIVAGYICYLLAMRFAQMRKKQLNKFKLVVISIILAVGTFIPSTFLSIKTLHNHPYIMTAAWQDGLEWIRTQTPTKEKYSVLTWWDYGYWVAREGERPVLCHPGGGSTGKVAKILISQNEEEATKLADKLGVKYIIIDYLMVTNKFYAMPMVTHESIPLGSDKYMNTMIVKLFFETGCSNYVKVFESQQQYKGEAQLRIFARKSNESDDG